MSCRRYVGKAFHRRARTDSSETSVTETVVCAWNDTYPLRRGLKLRAASVGNGLSIGSQGHSGVCARCVNT